MVISINALAKTFRVGARSRRVEAVKDATFDVAGNEIFGFIGPNGAGKSTTIHMMLNLIRPTKGTGTIFGEPLGSLAARRKLGYLPELPNFYGHLKARELLELGGRLAGMDYRTLHKRIPELMENVGLGGKEETLLKSFSKGMLQRVGFAQALVHDPELVILDEPMSGLDPIGRHVIRNLITELHRRGRTVFFSSHILPDIEALCHRVALINRGRTVMVAEVQALLSSGGERFEVQVRCPAETTPGDLPSVTSWQHYGDLLRLTVEGEQPLQAVVDWARGVGDLVAVMPAHTSLEEVVVRTMARQTEEVPS